MNKGRTYFVPTGFFQTWFYRRGVESCDATRVYNSRSTPNLDVRFHPFPLHPDRHLISFSKRTTNTNVRSHCSRTSPRPKFHAGEICLPIRECLVRYGENYYNAELWFSASIDLCKIAKGVLQKVVVYIPDTRGACCGYHFYL